MTLTPDARITSLYPSFTKSEKKIADFLLSQPDARYLSTVTLDRLAADIHTGQASIIRFIHKCGYTSYREFMATLGDVQYNNLINRRLLAFQNGDALYQNVSTHLASCVANLSSDDLDRAAQYLLGCTVVLCVGEGNSKNMAEFATHRLIHGNVFAVNVDGTQLPLLNPRMMERKQKILLLLFSISGESTSVVSVAEIYRQMDNVRIVAFTSHVESSLARLADVTFYAPSSDENHPQPVRGIDGLINMIFLMESLMNRYFALAEPTEEEDVAAAKGADQSSAPQDEETQGSVTAPEAP